MPSGYIKTIYEDKEQTQAVFPQTKVDAITDNNNETLSNILSSKQPKHTEHVISLLSTGWSNKEQSITIQGITTTNLIQVSPTPTDIIKYGQYGIYAIEQSANTLKFKCSITPSENIGVNVVVWEE